MSGFSMRIVLLDKQLVDAEGRLIGRVDDLELVVPPEAETPRIEHVLTGAEALGDRLGGLIGRAFAAPARRLRLDAKGPARVPVGLITELEPAVRLRVSLRELPHVGALERWLAHRLVGRIPGAGDAGE